MKLTAQFVARNGASFLDKLMMREQVRSVGSMYRNVHSRFFFCVCNFHRF